MRLKKRAERLEKMVIFLGEKQEMIAKAVTMCSESIETNAKTLGLVIKLVNSIMKVESEEEFIEDKQPMLPL